jgi:hypothetical protein
MHGPRKYPSSDSLEPTAHQRRLLPHAPVQCIGVASTQTPVPLPTRCTTATPRQPKSGLDGFVVVRKSQRGQQRPTLPLAGRTKAAARQPRSGPDGAAAVHTAPELRHRPHRRSTRRRLSPPRRRAALGRSTTCAIRREHRLSAHRGGIWGAPTSPTVFDSQAPLPPSGPAEAAARGGTDRGVVGCVEVYKWIVQALSISSDFWLRWLVHEA